MRILIFVFILSLTAFTATYTCNSVVYSTVDSAYQLTSAGDTITIVSDTATWTDSLEITHGVVIVGSDSTTRIESGLSSGRFLISYKPSTPATDTLVLSYLVVDGNSTSYSLNLYNNSVTATTARITNCRFVGCATGFWRITGRVWGVADNNIFTGNTHFDNYGLQVTSWTSTTFSYGSGDNFYYEDNVFTTSMVIASGGYGGRYCYRYNTFNVTADLYPMFDAHGNQADGVYSTMGVEIYCNLVNGNYKLRPLLDHRGGVALVFFNKINSTYYMTGNVTDEHSDTIEGQYGVNQIDGTPQHPSDGYYWQNRQNDVLTAFTEGTDVEGVLEENDEFYNHDESFDGTSGCGCGTLGSRPATCTPEVGYFATNYTCGNIPDSLVGADATVHFTDVFYKCTDTDTWEQYFTPYTYPHPLRGESDTVRIIHCNIEVTR